MDSLTTYLGRPLVNKPKASSAAARKLRLSGEPLREPYPGYSRTYTSTGAASWMGPARYPRSMAQPALPCVIKTLATGDEVAGNFQPMIWPAGFFHGTNPCSAAA